MNAYKKLPVLAALAGAVTLGANTMIVNNAEAGRVKCYGISKAGQNDCGNAAGTHGCAGHATVDFDGGEWKTMASKEKCLEANGKLEPFKGTGAGPA